MSRALYITAALAVALGACSDPESDWAEAERLGTVDAYQRFLERHADSEFAADAETGFKALHWPPLPLPEDQSPPEPALLRAEAAGGSGWGHVYKDATKQDVTGWGMAVGKGMLELGHNVFGIVAPGPCYVENRFEVANYDADRTLLRFDPEQQDSLVMAREGIGSLRSTAGCPGTRARFDGREYELRANGWYVDGTLVHVFAQQGD